MQLYRLSDPRLHLSSKRDRKYLRLRLTTLNENPDRCSSFTQSALCYMLLVMSEFLTSNHADHRKCDPNLLRATITCDSGLAETWLPCGQTREGCIIGR